MGIIARLVNHAIEKLITITAETVKAFNINSHLYTPAGDDSVPLKDERLLLVKVGGTGKYVCAGVLTSSQGARPGEKILFARNKEGKIVGKLSFLSDGTVKLEATNDFTKSIEGNAFASIEKNLEATIKGDIAIKGEGNVHQEAVNDFTIKGSKAQITGGSLQVDGAVSPTGSGPFCAMPACAITGAPHIGNIVTNT